MKFFVFILLLVAGWYVLTWLQRLGQQQPQRRAAGRRNGPAPRVMRATDTMVCKRCGTDVPSDFPTACDRADCPFPGVG
jgi:hypothetical protein